MKKIIGYPRLLMSAWMQLRLCGKLFMATIRLPQDFKEFLQLLNVHHFEYLVIDGYAVGYYGYPRATADMDIWIALAPPNAEKVVNV